MGKSRPRFNEKARASSRKPNQRPHPKARDGGLGQQAFEPSSTASQKQSNEGSDSNELMIVPGESNKNEAKERTNAKLTESFKEPEKYMSKKKRKKMEKYIEQKLKKDARAGLIEKLSTASWSSDLLKSSKLIGRSGQTLREQLRQAMLEQKAGVAISDESVPLVVEKEIEELPPMPEIVYAAEAPKEQPVVGSALAGGLPLVMRKRKKKQSTIPKIAKKRYKKRKGMESDSSFDSSDSENDDDDDDSEQQQQHTKVADLLLDEENNVTDATTQIEAVTEAAKHIVVDVPQRQEEEFDDIKVQLLKSNRQGDLAEDVAKPFYVPVNRTPEIQAARLKLPVCGEEQTIMEAIRNNTVVIICGETGSGKTTQVPQFLYEAGWSHPDSDNPGLIGVTQPRRVATVSMAKRVAQELNLTDKEVSHQIRYDATVSDKTRIKFMTDGVLLREMSQDLLLTKYSTIIIDEAHERNLNTDILIGVVSRVLKLRAELSRQDREKIKPLRVIIMSATLRVSDFTENKTLFPVVPPVINVNARQYPVAIHFNKKTPLDHVGEAYKKITKIHERLPHGGILVFLTGQNEINQLCKQLRKRYPALPPKATKKQVRKEEQAVALESKQVNEPAGKADIEDEALELGDNQVEEDFNLESDDDDDDIAEGFEDEELEDVKDAPLHVLPLYSMLPTEAQLRVFEPPPEGTRLCVIATNVAETSVTIPGVRYVVDCGKSKERKYNVETGVQSFEIDWTSQASAGQRAGRAGRTGPGHCYRLFSSAVFDNEFEKFSTPEIHRMPIEGVVLSMKSMNIDNVVNFPFPTPPPRENLFKAEKLLGYLGAVNTTTKRITEFGQTMSLFPITPRFAKMLIIGQQHGCLPFVIAIVSALSVGDPFIQDYHLDENQPEDDDDDEEDVGRRELHNITSESVAEKERRKLVRKKYYSSQMKHAGLDPSSDILKLLNVVGAYEYAGATAAFCDDNFLRPKAMEEIRKLRRQLTNLVSSHFPEVDICLDPKMKPPTAVQLKVLRQVLTAGFIDSVAIRQDVLETGGGKGVRYKNSRNVVYKLLWSDDEAFIHPSSVLYSQEPPAMLVYSELYQGGKTWLKGVTAVEAKWIAKIGKDLCSFGRPLDFPLPTYTSDKKDRKLVYVVPSFGPKSWPLPPIQVEQRREGTRWVTSL
ncbi:P-loop containing nucleoside triphosphate hydrolase protein [Mucor lusitanicus]|nr:P-loop containing nucleoside triphosphate hydrolase protein [Mucor lusitanicus]